jgi:ketosteroid isomerase-like protein
MFRKLLATLGLAALFALPLHAQATPDVAQTIKDLENQWGASMSAGNWDAVATFLTPDFISTGPDGKRLDRATYIANGKNSGNKVDWKPVPSATVLVSGGTAVHLGETTYSVTTKKGKVSRFHEVWTDTWVRQADGRWLCIASQYVDHPVK